MCLFSKQEKGNDGDANKLKKGPWSVEEDEKLRAYVSQYEEGNWDAVREKTEVFRCGKSCRFRWRNHLRPNLKKGPITREEELKIAELHAKIGPKWSLMVQELPGRTDNGIKNFWNIRTRKRTKLGLPLYDQIIKPHDHELNANGESTLSNQEQVDKSKTDIFSRKDPSVLNEINGNKFEQVPNSSHASIPHPGVSYMLCNNVSVASQTLTNRGGTPFLTVATESDVPQYQRCNSEWSKISQELPERRGNEIDDYPNIRTKKRARASLSLYDVGWNDINGETTCLDGLSNQHQTHVTQVHKSDIHGSNMGALISRGGTIMAMESDFSPVPECLDFQSSESQLHSYSLIHKYPLLPLRSPMEISEHSNANQMHSFETRLKYWLMKMERNQFL